MLDADQGFHALGTNNTGITGESELTTMVVTLPTIFNYVQDNLPTDYLMQQATMVVFKFINRLFQWSKNERSFPNTHRATLMFAYAGRLTIVVVDERNSTPTTAMQPRGSDREDCNEDSTVGMFTQMDILRALILSLKVEPIIASYEVRTQRHALALRAFRH